MCVLRHSSLRLTLIFMKLVPSIQIHLPLLEHGWLVSEKRRPLEVDSEYCSHFRSSQRWACWRFKRLYPNGWPGCVSYPPKERADDLGYLRVGQSIYLTNNATYRLSNIESDACRCTAMCVIIHPSVWLATYANASKGRDYDYQTLVMSFLENLMKSAYIIACFPEFLKPCVRLLPCFIFID